ncbi:bifunctional aspartate transaminase/aspartate 4-decarboxylase [Roseomonas eburnea]|uniref:Aspartate 4-decarboxylase n=1 Tax=Neoroseomonas eburnea TaxID=1346889 RepID=A0A9X9XGW6_9PROT|nr:bifunctional aspartate transaminase/aspartate 4-decarboxylase [Neoroseomonas eburnea]MBR0682952.1 bifunctional aspartate transaminase/aspartate 4-decarboxylase [Neoroseomonas eburnea]
MDPEAFRRFERMSPFEIKDELIRRARGGASFLNAGRGNPNWVATRPREAFFLLGRFAMAACRQGGEFGEGLALAPEAPGIAARLAGFLREDAPGAAFLRDAVAFATGELACDADAFVHEMACAVLGDTYPLPPRILPHVERVVAAYLRPVLGGPAAPFDLFATEGGTAAICDVFRSLRANRLLNAGDAIALGTPIFTPYLEIPALGDYALRALPMEAAEDRRFQYPDDSLRVLEDQAVKALLLVNPGNPTAVAIAPEGMARIAAIVRERRPDLLIVTDDVYATFVPGFRSLFAELPRNTIGIYSFSKYFGCTGWRLGVIAVARDNVLDDALAEQPDEVAEMRYAALSPTPRRMRLIDRMVADSRDVALNHTAGLSLPQQAMMALFALAELTDRHHAYRREVNAVLHRRSAAFAAALGFDPERNRLFDHYYGLADLDFWMRTHLGEAVAAWMRAHVHPLDIAFRLAEEHGIVLLPGGGFRAPGWSVRVSFANLPCEAYARIGQALRAVVGRYEASWRAAGAG